MWKPIATAPEKTIVLVTGYTEVGEDFYLSGQKIDGEWWGFDLDTKPGGTNMTPTHWLDVPDVATMGVSNEPLPVEILPIATIDGPPGYTLADAMFDHSATLLSDFEASKK